MSGIKEIQCALRDMLGHQNVIVEEREMAAWLTDWRGIYRGNAAAITFPRSTEEKTIPATT